MGHRPGSREDNEMDPCQKTEERGEVRRVLVFRHPTAETNEGDTKKGKAKKGKICGQAVLINQGTKSNRNPGCPRKGGNDVSVKVLGGKEERWRCNGDWRKGPRRTGPGGNSYVSENPFCIVGDEKKARNERGTQGKLFWVCWSGQYGSNNH